MHLVLRYKLHESQSGQISGYFIKLREWGQSLSLRKWLLHWAKRRSMTLPRVRLENRLVFNHHTNKLCKKTGRQVNALKRLCQHISQDVRMAVFRAFILSNFQYCPAIWHHCSVSNTKKKIEKIQERALRYVTNYYKSDYRYCQTSLPSLEEGQRQQIAIQTFKIVKKTFRRHTFWI